MHHKQLRLLILFGLYLAAAMPTAQAQIVLYENTGQKGKSLSVRSKIPQLSKHTMTKNRFLSDDDWNDEASSIKIDTGTAAFCWDSSNYQGHPVVFNNGSWDMNANGFCDNNSSIKIGKTNEDGSATLEGRHYLPVGGRLVGFPQAASATALKFAPQFDFDSDGCYAAAAVSKDNVANPGLEISTGYTKWGRNSDGLRQANTYVQRWVTKGANGDKYEFIMYALYFQKDVANEIIDKWSHKHDWEYVGVWLKNGKQEYAHCSAHSDAGERKQMSSRVRAVYHKDNVRTHGMRFAGKDEKDAENDLKEWFTPKILEWEYVPQPTRNILWNKENWGHANFPIRDEADEIDKYAPAGWPKGHDSKGNKIWTTAPKEKQQ